jgi:hypothetical protein
MMYHWKREAGLYLIQDVEGHTLAYCIDLHDEARPNAEKIVRALILQEIIDQRTEIAKSIAEKWRDGSKV